MCNNMADAGARAVMVVTPCYYKSQMTDSALEHHFLKVIMADWQYGQYSDAYKSCMYFGLNIINVYTTK